MTANAFFALGTKALLADGSPGARAELVRRGRDPETGKKVKAGEAAKAKPAAKPAAAPAPEPAAQPESGDRLFPELSGGERYRALQAEAKRLGLSARGKAVELEARIRAAAPTPESTPEAAPTPAPEAEVDCDAVLAGVKALVDETLRLRAEVASLKAKATTSAGTNRWAAIATQLARAGV